MRRSAKIFVSLLLVACFLVALASCNGDGSSTATSSATSADEASKGPEAKGYVFTVVLEDTGATVSGVFVQICKGSDFCLMPVASDKDGRVDYVLAEGNEMGEYEIHIVKGIPEGYTFDNDSVRTDASTVNYTLTLKKSGSASDVSADLSAPDNSDEVSESGSDVSSEVSDEVSSGGTCEHIFIGGVCSKCGEKEKLKYTVSVVYDSDFTDASGKKHKAGDPIEGVKLVITDSDGTNIVAMGNSDKNGVFSFEAKKYLVVEDGAVLGGYSIRITGGVPDGLGKDASYVFYGESTTATIGLFPFVKLSGAKKPYDPAFIKAGQTVHETINAARADDMLTAEDDSYYYYAFRPQSLSDEGLYRVSVKNVTGGAKMRIGHFVGNIAYVFGFPEEQSHGTDPSFEFKIEKAYITDVDGNFVDYNYWLIGVKVEDSSAKYPISFDLKIEKVRDLIPGKDYPIDVRNNVTLPEGTKRSDAITGTQTGTLTPVDLSSKLVKGKDGYYHIGSASGAYAFVAIKSHNAMLGEETNINFCNVNESAGVEQLCISYTVTENGITTLYYNMYHDALQAYGALCNKDGAYVLNDQLLEFLKGFARQNQLASELIGISMYK